MRKFQHGQSNRSGLATIEVAMCLIILSILLSAMFVILAYASTASGMAVVTRYRAWAGRHHPWNPHPESSSVSLDGIADTELNRILNGNARFAPSAALTAELRKQAIVFGAESEIVSSHFVVGGTWDHNEIPFDRHGRLSPSRKFDIFINRNLAWSKLRSLADFSKAQSVSNVKQKSAEYGQYQQYQKQGNQVLIGQVKQGIVQKESERSSLLQKISDLEQAEDTDLKELAKLRDDLQRVEDNLIHLREALRNLGDASDVRPNRR